MGITGIQIRSVLLFIILFLASVQGQSQYRLVLLHPTVSNIESMEWMVENKMIDIPGVELTGVYYAKEAYDYAASEKYLDEHKLKNYKLRKIDGDLKPHAFTQPSGHIGVPIKIAEYLKAKGI